MVVETSWWPSFSWTILMLLPEALVERPGEHVAQAVDGVFGGLLVGVEEAAAVEAGRAGGVEIVAAQERG